MTSLPAQFLVLLAFLSVNRAKFVSAAALADAQQVVLSKGNRHERQGWIYLHIEGSPRDRGFQHGFLLAPEIKEALRQTRVLWEYSSAMDWSWLVDQGKRLIEPKVDKESLTEIEGLVEGMQAAGVTSSRAEMVTFNAWIELDSYWWPKEKKKLDSNAPSPLKQSCSSFIATGKKTVNGNIVLGHNTMIDFPEAYYNVILDLWPSQGHRILMQTAPGLIHSGTDFFITDAGLVGAETTIGGFDGYEENGIPEFVRMRRATQDASSLDEWSAVMKHGNNGGYANAWLIGDVRSGEIARLELGLKHATFERTRDGFFLGSNIAENGKILRFETDVNETDVRLSSIARRVRWKQLVANSPKKIDLNLAQQFEADHFDSYLGKDYPGGRSLCGHFELDAQFWGTWPGSPFYPAGTIDAKVVDATMAKEMAFAARWGSACGQPFDAERFLETRPQFDWMKGILKSRPAHPWAVFKAGELN